MLSENVVTPLENGVQAFFISSRALDSGFRRNDKKSGFQAR